MEQMGSSRYLFGIQEDFQPLRGEAIEQDLMVLQLRSLMQEHLSTSASQLATPVNSNRTLKERRSPHSNLKLNVIKCLGW
jgi:hypothetical protein